MGSILSRAMIQDSGDSVWNTFFKEGLDDMAGMTDEDRKLALETFFFKPVDEIHRLILLSGPYRGSVDALAWYVRMGASFISLPKQILKVEQRIKVQKDKLSQEIVERYPSLPNSVDSLEPGSPTLMVLDKLGHKEGVPVHTIVGDRGKGDREWGHPSTRDD